MLGVLRVGSPHFFTAAATTPHSGFRIQVCKRQVVAALFAAPGRRIAAQTATLFAFLLFCSRSRRRRVMQAFGSFRILSLILGLLDLGIRLSLRLQRFLCRRKVFAY